MKFAIVVEIAVLALAGLLTISTLSASAQPSSRECWSMVGKVKTALASHPDASQTARDHFQAGQEACTKGYTQLGVTQLEAAMKDLGG